MSAASEISTMAAFHSMKIPVFSSTDMLKVRWRPFGDLQSSIQVADDLDAGANSTVSPYQLTAGTSPSFHQIASSPATEPPVSLIAVTISDLEDWAWRWAENHEDCGEGYDAENQRWIEEDGDEDDDDEDEPPRKLVHCCNQDRPQAPPPLKVRPTSKSFITVHDYITQAHAWVENLQADIVKALKENAGIRPSTPLYMTLFRLDTPNFRDDRQGRADRHWKAVAEHVQLRRDGRLVGGART
jgi:hypothetical protein